MSESLITGALKFMEQDFQEHEELFKNLAQNQKPHTLFISCCDSRVVPHLITNALPGELFIIRNIANIIPKYKLSSDFVSTTSSLEYALYFLEIRNVIICGHSNCGGCKAIWKDSSKFEASPNLEKWLENLRIVKNMVEKLKIDNVVFRDLTTERLNIVNSIVNLRTYPGISQMSKNGTIRIRGWHFDIERGEIFEYDEASGGFLLLK